MADERRPADQPDDATAINPPVDPWHAADDDATQVGPPLRSSTPVPKTPMPNDATRVEGAPISGAPVSGSGAGAEAPRWTARAGVRPPGAPVSTRPAWDDESPAVDPYGGRSWFAPIAIAIVVLLLLALLAVGGWLIYRATQGGPGDDPSVEPTTSTPAVTTAPATTPPATSAPATTAPAMVAVPDVIGDTEQVATGKFTALNIRVNVIRRVSTEQPPGRVISPDPAAGTMVPPDSTVQIVVALAPPTTAPPTPPSPSASS